MNFSTGWRTNKEREKRARVTRKPKIRWEVLGLPGAIDTNQTTSMDEIRRQVSHLASSGLEQANTPVIDVRDITISDQRPKSRRRPSSETLS
jgi:hypothetical protein